MLGLGWSEWSTISTLFSILLALIPVVIRFRQVLVKLQDLITEFVGIIVLMGGLYVYVTQDQIARLSVQSGVLGQEMQSVNILFFGAIGLMTMGGLLMLFGVVGRVMTDPKKR